MRRSGTTNRISKASGWILTYGDMTSLLVVFFVLFFAVSHRPPREVHRRCAPVEGRPSRLHDTPVRGRSDVPGPWTPLGHIKYRAGSTRLEAGELAFLQDALLPRLLATSATVFLVSVERGDGATAPHDARAWERVLGLRKLLVARGLAPGRVVPLETSCGTLFEPVIARGPAWRGERRVSIWLAPRPAPRPGPFTGTAGPGARTGRALAPADRSFPAASGRPGGPFARPLRRVRAGTGHRDALMLSGGARSLPASRAPLPDPGGLCVSGPASRGPGLPSRPATRRPALPGTRPSGTQAPSPPREDER